MSFGSLKKIGKKVVKYAKAAVKPIAGQFGGDKGGNDAPAASTQSMQDVARSQAAGAGTVGYTGREMV